MLRVPQDHPRISDLLGELKVVSCKSGLLWGRVQCKISKGTGNMGYSLGEASMNLHQSPPCEAQEPPHFLQQQVVTHMKCHLPGSLSETEHQGPGGWSQRRHLPCTCWSSRLPEESRCSACTGWYSVGPVGQACHLGSSGKALTAKFPNTSQGHLASRSFQENSQLAVVTLFCTLSYVHALFENNIIFPHYRNSACALLGKLQNTD